MLDWISFHDFLCAEYNYFQTARPILYDASTVNEMIADVDRIDIVSISSQALYTNTEDTEKSELDADLNSECKWIS